MQAIKLIGEAGQVRFIPSRISSAKFLKIEQGLKKLLGVPRNFMSSAEMRAILREKDSLIGTPGGLMRAYREREGMTQIALAKKSGIRQGHISEMEKNKRPIGVSVAKKIARAMRFDYRRLF